MARPRPVQPTDAELQILHAMWELGPSTQTRLAHRLDGQVPYTSVLRLLQVMHDKGLVCRDDAVRPIVYTAAVTKAQTQRSLAKRLLDRAFRGRASDLVMHLLAGKRLSADERAAIRSVLQRIDAPADVGPKSKAPRPPPGP